MKAVKEIAAYRKVFIGELKTIPSNKKRCIGKINQFTYVYLDLS